MSTSPSTTVPDPTRFAFPEELPTVTQVGFETADGVTVTDLLFEATGVEPTEAYLVAPEPGTANAPTLTAPGPGIIWFHWLEYGNPTSNRTEFLEEAKTLAGQGVTSILVQGNLPWNDSPTSIAHDVPAVEADVRMLRAALGIIGPRGEIDGDRLALVGHDFGAMYNAVFFGADLHLDAMVMMAPTARWADWFYRYWEIKDSEADYLAAMAGLDPVTWLPLTDGRPVLLQFASNDQYVPEEVADAISAAAGSSAETRTYDTNHEMNDDARAERDAWLAETLGFPAPPD
jgi:predicted esterase